MQRRQEIILIVLIIPVLTLARRLIFPVQSTDSRTASSLPAAPDISNASGFILEWQATKESPRLAYRLSSPDGVKRMKVWAIAHARQLETSVRIAPILAAIPNDRLWIIEKDGAFRGVPLVASYPADFTIPKAQRQDFIENLTASDFESLRRIFTETGDVEKSPTIP